MLQPRNRLEQPVKSLQSRISQICDAEERLRLCKDLAENACRDLVCALAFPISLLRAEKSFSVEMKKQFLASVGPTERWLPNLRRALAR